MKATTKIQAIKIAEAGAKKMVGRYSLRPGRLQSLGQVWVKNLETSKEYLVNPSEDHTFSTCPFFRENRGFGVCKHSVYAGEELAQEARWIAEDRDREYAAADRYAKF